MRSKFILAVLVLLALLAALAWWGTESYRAELYTPASNTIPITFEVKPGMTAGQAVAVLKAKGLIHHPRWITLYLNATGMAPLLAAGTYTAEPGMTPAAILDLLVAGKTTMARVTVPEGLNLREIAARVAAVGLGDAERFVSEANDRDLIARLTGARLASLEGFLFPDTYEFAPGTAPATILETMVKRYREVQARVDAAGVTAGNHTPYQRLILASIVEKEAKTPAERPLVASVFFNRLKLGRRLESCATVLYALGIHKNNLSLQDLKINSPYNTYLVMALPPTPICSPGEASLAAAARPIATKYLYFVSRNDGTHEFSATLEEHERMRRKYQP